jgi:ligand-binding sensor domain-containing protein/signal transduction histidine kinase
MMAALGVLCLSFPAESEPLPFRHFSTRNGLVHNHVNALFSDSRGFLWICTDEGLARFDGQQFKTYTQQNGIPHIHVNAIVETRDGEYWIATDGGVARFHPRRAQFESFTPGNGGAQFVNTLAEDRDGTLLAGTNRGLYRVVRGASIRIEVVLADAPPILQVLVDTKGEWWIATERGLRRRSPDGTWRQELSSDFIGEIAFDRRGQVWIGTKRGVVRLDGTVELVPPDPDVRSIWFDRDGRAWLGTMNGLAEWDPEGRRILHFYRRDEGLVDETIYTIAEDSAGNLWFGTRRGGLLELPRSEIRTYGVETGLTLSGDDLLIETTDGAICTASIGDSRRPLDCLEAGRFVRAFPKLPPAIVASPITSSQATLQDRTGAWWISSGKGLLRLPGFQLGPDRWLLSNLESRRLLEDPAGNIWVETKRGKVCGLAKWDARTRCIVDFSARLPRRASSDSISALAAAGGDLWLGLGRPGGLLRLRGNTVDEVRGIPPGTVNALHVDRRGHIWVATSDAGLAEVDVSGVRPSVHLYEAQSQLSSNEVWCITEDRQGRVYAGTARGVDRIDAGRGTVLHYTAEDGIAEGDIRAALCDRHGDLWFLSNRGLSQLRVAVEAPPAPPTPRISELRAGGRLELVSEFGETQAGLLHLEPDQTSVAIEFLAVMHRAPWRLRYQYHLQGARGSEWSELSTEHSVSFPHLAAASYRFEVRSVGETGEHSPAATVEFELPPPFWRRAWFFAALLSFALASAYALHLYRVNHLLQLERVRTRLATDLHDDLGAGLAEIAILSEVAKRQPAAEVAVALEYTAARARGLRAALSDIVWTVDPTRDSLADLIRRMRETALTMLESEERTVRFLAPAGRELEGIELTPELRRHLLLFFKEAVTNIARHSGATAVHLELALADGYLHIVIRDNGCGFDLHTPAAGRGLTSLRYRASEIKGDLRLESTPGRGTEIELRAPLSA